MLDDHADKHALYSLRLALALSLTFYAR